MNAKSPRSIRCFASLAVFLSFAGGSPAQTYDAVVIPLLPGTTRSTALGINDAGDVVGWCFTAPNSYRAFLYERATGTTTDIGALGGGTSQVEIGAHSINNKGEVVGVSSAGGLTRAFHWSDTGGFANISFTPPSSPPHQSAALAIGDAGQIGGFNSFPCVVSPAASILAAALWPSSTDQPAPVFATPFPCGFAGIVHGVNSSGAACGETLTNSNGSNWTRPALLSAAGTVTALATFSGVSENGHAYDINDDGWLCGDAEDRSAGVTSTASVWSPAGQITNLGGAPLGRALALNNGLSVVGWVSNGVNLKLGVIWQGFVPGQPAPAATDLNSVLSAPVPGGLSITSAEDIANTGFIAARLGETSAGARAVLLVPAPPPCTADFNTDGLVNSADLVIFLGRFGQPTSPGGTGDLNIDGTVNVQDLTILLGQFGRSCP